MSIEQRLRESFSEITPPTDNAAMVKNVIERAENMKNDNNRTPRLSRTAVTVIAAAAVLAAATISVGAATGWSFNFSFEKANETIVQQHGVHEIKAYSTAEAEPEPANAAEKPIIDGETFDWLSGGKELDLWYSFDNFKLNIKGVCADDYVAYVLYDIVFDEDFDCSPKVGWTGWETCTLADAVDDTLTEQPELGMVHGMDEGVISQEGNVLHCYIIPKLFHEYSWGGKTMTLDFMSVRRYIPTHSEKEDLPYYDKEELSFGDEGFRVCVPIDFPIFEAATWEINKPLDLAANNSNRYWYGESIPAVVKYFSATPLSWRVYVEADTSDFTKGDGYQFDLSISAGDENAETVTGMGSEWVDDNGQGSSGFFESPINPADITAITLCGESFELG